MNDYENEVKECCSNAKFTLDEIAELEAKLHKKEAEIAYLKEKMKYMSEPNDFKYTPEMALFEIWGALQTSNITYDVQNIARAAMERAGLLEAKENAG